ncbi:MAG: hypothetical protein Hals2KO_33610 [Halioglobus sp.]
MQAQLDLHRHLDQEVLNLQAILDVLRQEHTALTEADVDAIERITASKNQLLSIQLELTQSRRRLTHAVCGSATEESLGQYIESSAQPGLTQSYSRLQELAAECNLANRTNGRLITQRQQHTRGALDILRHTDSTAATYSHAGKSATEGQAGRTLGKA